MKKAARPSSPSRIQYGLPIFKPAGRPDYAYACAVYLGLVCNAQQQGLYFHFHFHFLVSLSTVFHLDLEIWKTHLIAPVVTPVISAKAMSRAELQRDV
ncbi:unnamed protein product [Urochloa humidicola]